MRMGKCINLTLLTPNIIQGGGATGTWTALSSSHGTFEVNFPPSSSCPGGDPESFIDPYASCTIKFAGCGTVHLTAAGTSGTVMGRPYAYSELLLAGGLGPSSQPVLTLVGGTGGVSCESVGLTGDDDVTFKVTCGMELTLTFDGLDSALAPASDVIFDVKIEA